jgi:hypothetical protein
MKYLHTLQKRYSAPEKEKSVLNSYVRCLHDTNKKIKAIMIVPFMPIKIMELKRYKARSLGDVQDRLKISN